MNRLFWMLPVALGIWFPLFGQSEDCRPTTEFFIESSEKANPWTSPDINRDECRFQFAIVTDRTGRHRPGIFEDAVHKLNLLQPEFVMSVGDLIEGYTEDISVLNREWSEFNGFVDQLEMPFFYVPGNHDITNEVMEGVWKKQFGRTFYHFIYRDVLFLCLNSEDQKLGAGRGTISPPQYEYIKRVLEENREVKWTFVFMHQPLWTQHDTRRWKDVEALLADRKHTVFAGHHHQYVKYERNNGKYFVLATTGGGSKLRGPRFGEFDHVVWVTMTEDGPVLANLLLEGIWHENVSTEFIKGLITRIVEEKAISFKPIVIDDEHFTELKLRVKIRNNENIPMKVKISEGFSFDMYLEPEERAFEVAPNSKKLVSIKIFARRRMPVVKMQPIPVKIELSFELEGEPKGLTIPFEYKVKPFPKKRLSVADRPISVDGDLKDWAHLPLKMKTEDKKDLDVKFDIKKGEDFLYLAAHIRDDVISVDSGLPVWKQDCINWVFNFEPALKSAMSKGKGWYSEEFCLRVTPGKGAYSFTVFEKEKLPAGVKTAVKESKDGYTLEAAIPLALIREKQGGSWESFRFNVYVDDRDSPEGKVERFWWYPDWMGKENFVGSGLVFNNE